MRRNIYILCAIACLQGMVFYGPVATLYRTARGVSVWEITLIESVSLALCLLLEAPWGVLADRIGYRRTMLLCNGLYLISKVVFWQADSFAAFLAERLLLSVVLSGLSGVDTAMLYLSCERETSHRIFGIYEGLQTVGLLAAAFVYAGVIGEDYGLAAALTVAAYALAAGLTLLLRDRQMLLFLAGAALLRGCCVAGAVACGLLAVTNSGIASVLAVLALRVSCSLMQPLQTEVQNRRVATVDRATALSVYAVAMNGVGMGVYVLFGALAEAAVSAAFVFGGGLCLLGLWLMQRACAE